MPITDYKKRADRTELQIQEHPKISQSNKSLIQRFLVSYDVSDGRRLLFLCHIQKLLIFFPDMEEALRNRDKMNDFFAELRRNYRPASYATVHGVTRRFLKWLNDGKEPQSLRDIKIRSRKTLRRELKPEDMITWEEGQRMADVSCDLQMAAIILTQLDCGFRPSEFIDLKYGDVMRQTGLVVISVRAGKTGARHVVAQRCVPALLKWMDSHPTKKDEDPLWVAMNSMRKVASGEINIGPYKYYAMRKRLQFLAQKSKISKPVDYYAIRHSSCVLDKMDNLPVDLAAERHGHSVKHFVETYGRLSVKDVMKRFRSHYGDDEEEAKPTQNRTCQTCGASCRPESKWCASCATPLNTEGATEMAIQHGMYQRGKKQAVEKELESLRMQLAAARKREENFRKEQLSMLAQVEDIRLALRDQR